MTPAQKYIASLYEHCVDKDMDVDEVRRYLLTQGVLRTPGMVAYELEHTYGFHQYAAAHQPKPVMSVRDFDRAVEREQSIRS
jgi:hypothetical protein